MAEATGLRNNALPYPVYGVPWGIAFPLLDADGDPVSPSSPDSEISKNGDTFADCTNEATEIATSSGHCFLLLTGTEMTTDVAVVRIQSTGAKTTPIVLHPRKLVTLRTGTVGANAADGTTLQLDSGASAIDDYYNGCLLVGTLDSTVEARIIGDYVGSTKVCTVKGPAFTISPDNNDTFEILLPEGRQVGQADTVAFNGVTATASAGRPEVNATHLGGTSQTGRDIGASVLLSNGTGAGQVSLSSGTVTAGTVSDKTGYRLSATGVDDILDEAITEPGGVFSWGSATLRNIIGWIGALARNKVTQTATTQTLRNDADNASLASSTHSDDGTTHTRGEWS